MMSACTSCGSPAYVGALSVECSNVDCPFYVPPSGRQIARPATRMLCHLCGRSEATVWMTNGGMHMHCENYSCIGHCVEAGCPYRP